MHEDLWRLRLRRDAFRPVDPGFRVGGAPAFVGKVISTGTNLAVGKFFKVNPVTMTGAETEGGAATATADTSTEALVYAVGPAAPATNDLVVCRYVDYRWVADKQTLTATTTHGSGCTSICSSLPLAITITPQPGNGGNFFDVTTVLNFTTTGPAATFASSALTNAGENSTNCWWSDPIPKSGGLVYYFVFNCGQYASGGAAGSGHLSYVNRIGSSGTIADYQVFPHAYLFNGTSTCSPFLQTGTVQTTSLGSEAWTASG